MEYVIHGTNPKILFLSGMHGDEYESSNLLEKWLKTTTQILPPYLSISKVSPSAVASRTRKNKFGNDINRQFLKTTHDPEALEIMNFLKTYVFTLAIDLHEDPDRSKSFYLYDSQAMSHEQLEAYRRLVHKTGARLYTGVDDRDDAHLRKNIDKGYISLPMDTLSKESGFSSVWLIRERIVKRAFTLEIPGKAPVWLKQCLIEDSIPFLISSLTQSFFQIVYDLVQHVPPGYVTTYGHIAKALHTRDARRVGHALHANRDGNKTPCHRVVFSDGRLAPGYAFGGPNEQLRRLQREGISFLKDGRVDLRKFLFTF